MRAATALTKTKWTSALGVLTITLFVPGQVFGSGSTTSETDQPPACDSLLQKAKQAEKSGKFSEAAEYYLDCLRVDPHAGGDLFQRLGLDYYLDSRFGDAIPAFIQALKLRRDLWGSALFLGISYYRMGQFEKALGPLNESLQLKPDLHEAHLWLGASLLALSHTEAAISELQRASKQPALGLEADSFLVDAYRKAAEGYYRRVETADPDSYRVYQFQAELSAWEGKLTEAVIEYREALRRKPDLEEAHRAIANLSGRVVYWTRRKRNMKKSYVLIPLTAHPDSPSVSIGSTAEISSGHGRTWK